jgi:TonB family protein
MLRRDGNHAFNRFYLLGSLLLSVVAPGIDLVFPAAINASFPILPVLTPVGQALHIDGTPALTAHHHWQDVLLAATAAISILMLLGLLFKMLRIARIIYQARRLRSAGCILVENSQYTLGSFLHYIFVSDIDKALSPNHHLPLLHERVHVRRMHTADVLVAELIRCIFWFNPLSHLYLKAIRLNHEYEADAAVLEHTTTQEYAFHLTRAAFSGSTLSLTNPFSYSFTLKRLKMLEKTTMLSSRLRLAMVTTLLCLACFIVACQPDTNDVSAASTEDVDQLPEPKEGMSAMYRYISREIKYPVEARRSASVGTVYVQFDVDKQGNVANYKVVRGVVPALDAEVLRAVQVGASHFEWLPARRLDKYVGVTMVLPVQYKLDGVQPTPQTEIAAPHVPHNMEEIVVVGYPPKP